jgi:hypothetical protein
MKKLPAFTLLETLLALVLMAVVGMLATGVMQHLGKGSVHFRERHALEAELVELNMALRSDHAKATHLLHDPQGGTLFIGRNDTVRYSVLPDSSVERRRAGNSMVFHVRASEPRWSSVPGTMLVARWQLDIALMEETRTLFITPAPLTAARLQATAHHGHPHTR